MKRKYFSKNKKKTFEPYIIPQENIPSGVIVAVNRQIFPLILDIIKSAKKSICIVIFQVNISGEKKTGVPYTLYSYLWNKIKQNVSVKVLLNKRFANFRQFFLNQKTKQTLELLGVNVKFASGKKTLHTKLILVDDTTAYIGSTNLTVTSLCDNWEIGVKIEGEQVKDIILPYFKMLWHGGEN